MKTSSFFCIFLNFLVGALALIYGISPLAYFLGGIGLLFCFDALCDTIKEVKESK